MAKALKERLEGAHKGKERWFLLQDRLFRGFAIASTAIGLAVLILLIYNILSQGIGRIDFDFLTNLPSRRPAKAGIYTAMVGTLWIMLLTAIIAFPIGIAAGIYLEEYNPKSRLSRIIEINIANLAGVPSIIYGLLGLEIFARTLGLGGSILTGALTLSLLILPVVIVSTRETLKNVPKSMREGSLGLGASKWQTIWYQVLPASSPGILTGCILGLSRAIGETAPLIVIGALTFVPFVPEVFNTTAPYVHPSGFMDEFSVLPMQIFNWVSRPQKAFAVNAAAAIIILLSITFILNGLAVYLRYRWKSKIKW